MNKVVLITVVVLIVLIVGIFVAGVVLTPSRGGGDWSPFVGLDHAGWAGEFVGCWRTPGDFEKQTARKFPRYGESPTLAKKVKAGLLPPVERRLPEEPLVVHPVERPGLYGGVLKNIGRSSTPMHYFNGFSSARILALDRDYKTIAPHLARDWEFSRGGKTLTITLRKGLKWSDGHPFTTEDIMFWYEDVIRNEELTPTPPEYMIVDDEMMVFEAVDEVTYRIKAPRPIPLFVNRLAHAMGLQGLGSYDCKHYMKQFHADYADPDELRKKMDEAEVFSWVELFKLKQYNVWKCGMKSAQGCPVMAAYVQESSQTNRVVMRRNPYYWKVDSAGQQLPYIDKIVSVVVDDVEVRKLKLMTGGVDFLLEAAALREKPALDKFADRGGYTVLVWTGAFGNMCRYALNLTAVKNPKTQQPDEVKRKIYNDRRFRIALSLAINRKEINDTVYFGAAVPCQTTLVPNKKYSSIFEEEFADAYVRYDPAEANRLLDEMGLTERNSEGIRLMPDGRPLNIVLIHNLKWTEKELIHELVRDYWQRIGVRLIVNTMDQSILYSRMGQGSYDMGCWHLNGACDPVFFIHPYAFAPLNKTTLWGPLWYEWRVSKGAEGEVPPPEVMKLFDYVNRMRTSMDPDKRAEAGRKILRSQAHNVWSIGTVAMSPRLVVVNRHLRNVPKEAPVAWDYFHTCPLPPEAFFFDDEKRRAETLP